MISVDSRGKDKVGNGVKVEIGEPVVVTMGPSKERRWGFYQFPHFWQTKKGELVATCHVGDDSHDDAGERQPSPYFITHDSGKTWEKFTDKDALQHARVLGDGTQIRSVERQKRPAKEIGLNPVHKYSRGCTSNLYLYEDLPEEMKGIKLFIRKPGSNTEEEVIAPLEMPRLCIGAMTLTRTSKGWVKLAGNIHPLVLELTWTECLELSDGTLCYTIKAVRMDEKNNVLPGQSQMYLLASTNKGRSWQLRSTVAYIPDQAQWGLHEPTLTCLKNGTLVCVMRSDEGKDPRNLFISISKDDGFTWSKPYVLNHFGVEPELLTLENGVTVVSYGRPGVELRFSYDGNGEKWTKPYIIYPRQTTCGYTKLWATGPDRFLIIYSDFDHKDNEGEIHKAIKVKEVQITRLDSLST